MQKAFFYYSQLPDVQSQKLYRSILLGVRAQKNQVLVEGVSLDKDRITQVYHAINYDYPELFYMTLFGEGCSYRSFPNGDLECRFVYRYPLPERLKKIKEQKEFVQHLLSRLPEHAGQSQYLTALWLHDLVALNVRYDHAAKGHSDEQPEAFSIEGSINAKKAVCAGIARLYMMLCEQKNIWCTYIPGVSRLSEEDRAANVEGASGRHAWNLLRLDGQFTYADVTWDLCSGDSDTVSHTYFGMSDEFCFLKRTPDRDFPSIRIPPCGDGMSFFVREHCQFNSMEQLRTFMREQIRQRKAHFEFRIVPLGQPADLLRRQVDECMAQAAKRTGQLSEWVWVSHSATQNFSFDLVYR